MRQELNSLTNRNDVGLFPQRTNTYVIIDGATCPDLIDHLNADQPEYLCLYRGDLEPDMVAVAPFLVLLKKDHAFTKWILEKSFGQHWGIFVITSANMIEVRKHFRGLTMVESPDGKPIYFRFYDPRVLSDFIPTCNEHELNKLFGPVDYFLAEDVEKNTMIKHTAPANSVFVPGTLKIRQAQMDKLGKNQQKKTIKSLSSDLRQNLPAQTKPYDDVALVAFVEKGVLEAESFGITGARDVADYVSFMLIFGSDYIARDVFPGAKEILNNPDFTVGAVKMDKIRDLIGV